MSMLGKIRDKVLHRNDSNLDDVRTRVLGDRFRRPFDEREERPFEQGMFDREPERFGAEEPMPPRSMEIPRIPEAPGPDVFTREPISLRQDETRSNYEIIDRLNFIENQLSAIKSQTETINERLKNMEAREGRRY